MAQIEELATPQLESALVAFPTTQEPIAAISPSVSRHCRVGGFSTVCLIADECEQRIVLIRRAEAEAHVILSREPVTVWLGSVAPTARKVSTESNWRRCLSV